MRAGKQVKSSTAVILCRPTLYAILLGRVWASPSAEAAHELIAGLRYECEIVRQAIDR